MEQVVQAHKLKLVYDITSIPNGLDPGNLVKLYESNNVVFWDSKKDGVKPALFNTATDEEVELALIDVKGNEVELEPFMQEYMDKEFWDKELHKCKQSPIYYYNNYLTKTYPVTDVKLAEYLKSVGLGELPADDSEEAKKAWEAAKQDRKKATAHVTVEELKDLRPFVEEMTKNYNAKIKELEEKYKNRITDTKTGVEKSEREKKAIIISAIKKCPIPSGYSSYRNSKGKWDIAMLGATDYSILLEMFDKMQLSAV